MRGQVHYAARVLHAAFEWGVPFALYWEFFDNNSTMPLVPRSGQVTKLYTVFRNFFSAAKCFVHRNRVAPFAQSVMSLYATRYFAALELSDRSSKFVECPKFVRYNYLQPGPRAPIQT